MKYLRTIAKASVGLGMMLVTQAQAAAMNGSVQKFPSVDPVLGDHYQCYDILKAETLKLETIVVTDQFGQTKMVLARPVTLCNPSMKVHGNKTYKVEDQQKHLVCYAILEQSQQKHHKMTIGNQFHITTAEIADRKAFCVPSHKTLLGEKEFPF